jgi:hypothetical protein
MATHFLNVDLDIWSRYDLQPLVDAFGKKVFVLYVGHHRRKLRAHFELARHTTSADAAIRAFCRLTGALPKMEREIWDAAAVRDFSIGIQAGTHPNPCDFVTEAKTVNAVGALAARIVFTIYPKEEPST